MKNLNVYEVVTKVPKNSNIISSRWVFKYKRDPYGNIVKRKARIVAKGYTQRFGIDYWETYAPTLKHDSLRILVAISVQRRFIIKQIDINAAYLNVKM